MAKNFSCVYKYESPEGEVLYIGKAVPTALELKKRVSTHAIDKAFEPYISNAKIYYAECDSSSQAEALEVLLIEHYHPCLNQLLICKQESFASTVLNVEKIEWKPYSEYLDFLIEKHGTRSRKKGTGEEKSTKTYLRGGEEVSYVTVAINKQTEEKMRAVENYFGGRTAFMNSALTYYLESNQEEINDLIRIREKLKIV